MNLGTIKFSAVGKSLSRHRTDNLQRRKTRRLLADAHFAVAIAQNEIEVFTSELTLLETLVQPIKQNNQSLVSAYESLLIKTDVKLEPISLDILRRAANFRAAQNLKTPDAVHASTAIASNCSYFVTNDDGFKRLSNFKVIILSELI